MLAIGLILILVAAGGGAYLGWLAVQSSTPVPLSGGGLSFGVLPITLLAAGAVAVLLLWAGFRLVAVGFRRRRAQRRELKELRSSGGSPSPVRPTGRVGPVGNDQTGSGGRSADDGLDRTQSRRPPSDGGPERKVDPRA